MLEHRTDRNARGSLDGIAAAPGAQERDSDCAGDELLRACQRLGGCNGGRKDLVTLPYFDIQSQRGAVASGFQEGDIPWRSGSWSYVGALVANVKLGTTGLTDRSIEGWQESLKAARSAPIAMTVLRRDKLVTLPVGPAAAQDFGVQIDWRLVPVDQFLDLAKRYR